VTWSCSVKNMASHSIIKECSKCHKMLITEDQHCNNLSFINLYRPGELLTCADGKLSYKVVPELDYYRGCPTILTSEEAALVVCNKIFNSLDNDTEFFD
jgi:D-arabinose 1-dehydrogenase-like Zn-dependent alcohol dehydrogenase